jgi:ubiquinone biosynthesis protein COQ9
MAMNEILFYVFFLTIERYICGMSKASMQDITTVKNKVIQAALDLAKVKSWADISFYKISEKAEIDESEMAVLFDDKDAVLAAYSHQVDLKVMETFSNAEQGQESERDNLFDVLMERFDILNENREAVVSIINSITFDPKQAVMSLPYLCKSMNCMADTAGINTDGFRGVFKISALTGIYLKALKVWIKDDSSDMAATMASLDKGLGYLEKI